MKVAIVDPDLSYPPTNGKRLRTLHLMVRLAKRHDITYLCRSDPRTPKEAKEARVYLADHRIQTTMIDHQLTPKKGLRFYTKLALNLLSPLPYSIAAHDGPQIRQAIRRHAESVPVDLWQFEWSAYVDALDGMPRVPRIVIAPNIDSLIWQRYYETERHFLKRWYIKQQWHKLLRHERRTFHDCDRLVTVSDEDACVAREWFGVDHVSVVENGMDRKFFEGVQGGQDPKRILLLGSLDYRPNIDAVDIMLDQVLPRVLAREPDARLCIVGRSPSERLTMRVKRHPGVELHADVADVRPFLAKSGVLVVPLRVGGGSRLKILEALAAGLPVVSTRVGAEGLDLVPGRHLEIADTPEQMAAAAVKSMRDPGKALAAARAGRAHVFERYDWDVLADKLEQVWLSCARGGEVAAQVLAAGTRLFC
jgi:glycosyltransferase involved in cell wall biosynthesis